MNQIDRNGDKHCEYVSTRSTVLLLRVGVRRQRAERSALCATRPEIPRGLGLSKNETGHETGTHYILMIVTGPRDEVLEHDFQIVLANTHQPPNEVSASFFDDKNDRASIVALQNAGPPFYRAPDFEG